MRAFILLTAVCWLLTTFAFSASDHPSRWAGCVGYWSGSGTAADASLQGNHGYVSNSVNFVAGPKFGAFEFPIKHLSNVVYVANGLLPISTKSNWTVACYVMPYSGTHNMPFSETGRKAVALCAMEDFGVNSYYVFVGGSYRAYNITGSGYAYSNWNHIAFVKTGSGNNGNLYVNGRLQTSFSGSIGSTPVMTNMNIGSYYEGNGDHMLGRIAEFYLFDRALTEFEVNDLRVRTGP